MEEQREESEFFGDCREPMEETGKGLVLSSETETLDGEIDVQQIESCIEDANTFDVSDLGVCDVSVTDENPNGGGSAAEDDNSVSEEKQVQEDTVDEIESSELCDDVQRVNETVKLVEVDIKDEAAMSEVKSKNGGSHEVPGKEKIVISGGNEVIDEKEVFEVDDYGDACDPEHIVQSEKSQQSLVDDEMLSVAENKADQGKEAKHSESAQVSEEPTELSKGESDEEYPGAVLEVSSAAGLCLEEEITNVNHQEENGEAIEIDSAEEHLGKDVEAAGATVVQTQVEADGNDSNVVNEMEIDELEENVDMATDLTDPNSPSEDAATGNIQDLKTDTGNVSLKENTKAIDLPVEVATVDCKEALNTGDATVNGESNGNLSLAAATESPREGCDAIMGSDENQEEKDHESLDQQNTMREEDDTTHEAPSIDANQKEDTEMEEIPNNSDYGDDGTDSDTKTNGVKRKADVLSEDSLGEGRKTVSLAKVSYAERPSFKIGAGIARAASQMAGSPSVLKGSNIGDDTLSVESFVSQLHCAATDPVKEDVVSEIAAGFFLDFRNSSASQQVASEKVNRKRGRPSNSNARGTEAYEYEEMGDTYWTDRVIHNGGEEQTPATKKGNYRVVPVELKPAQVKRTRRPYRKRQSQISIPLPSASDKPADFDENAPAELIMNFSETDTIPPEKSLSKMFRHFGPIRESQTEVDKENNRARVVYRKGSDAEVAYNSAGRFSIFGEKAVNYELSYTITEAFKVQPYVVSLGEDDAALCPS